MSKIAIPGTISRGSVWANNKAATDTATDMFTSASRDPEMMLAKLLERMFYY
jgi:hypothetical protein